MLVTEAQIIDEEIHCHRCMGTGLDNLCRGPQCMAWRWDDNHQPNIYVYAANDRATEEPERPPEVPAHWAFRPYRPEFRREPAGWVEPQSEYEARWPGYCGEIGKPTGKKK